MSGNKTNRQEVKKAWLGIKMIINLGDCTNSEMKQLVSTEKEFFDNLTKASSEEANRDDVLRRREEAEESGEMQEILQLFWFVVSQNRDTTTNELTKQGYVQFNLRLQR